MSVDVTVVKRILAEIFVSIADSSVFVKIVESRTIVTNGPGSPLKDAAWAYFNVSLLNNVEI